RALVVVRRKVEGGEGRAARRRGLPGAAPAGTRRTPRPVAVVGLVLGALAVVAALLVGAVTIYDRFWSRYGDPVAKGEPIRVGVLFSQRGTTREHEQPLIEAVELAVAEINKQGGVMGRPVEAVVADGASDEDRFARQASRLIEEEKVAVIFGCWSSSARRRVTEVCRDHDRLLFFPSGDE